jgi:hypothetical protein
MNSMQRCRNRCRTTVVVTGALGCALVAATAYSAVSQIIGVGTMADSDLIGGPATLTMRTLTIAPGEVLGWHYHPGAGAFTIVTTGAHARGRLRRRNRLHGGAGVPRAAQSRAPR